MATLDDLIVFMFTDGLVTAVALFQMALEKTSYPRVAIFYFMPTHYVKQNIPLTVGQKFRKLKKLKNSKTQKLPKPRKPRK